MTANLDCQFCGDTDFDGMGLKHHLSSGHCDPFNATEDIGTTVLGVETQPVTVTVPVEQLREALLQSVANSWFCSWPECLFSGRYTNIPGDEVVDRPHTAPCPLARDE